MTVKEISVAVEGTLRLFFRWFGEECAMLGPVAGLSYVVTFAVGLNRAVVFNLRQNSACVCRRSFV